MYFAQEFVPLNWAILAASAIALAVIVIRSLTMVPQRLALFGITLPAGLILALTIAAAIHPRLQGILITATGLALFVVTMTLLPRVRGQTAARLASEPSAA